VAHSLQKAFKNPVELSLVRVQRIPASLPRRVTPRPRLSSAIELDAALLESEPALPVVPRATNSSSGYAPRLKNVEPVVAPPAPPVAIVAPVAAAVAAPLARPRTRDRLPTLAFVLPMMRPSVKTLAGYLTVGVAIGAALGAIALVAVRLAHHF
jgi:hypothetical protein